jgi:methionyl-tRNA formyltransferase
MHQRMRIIFFGTPEFAVDSLDILVSEGYEIAAVVTAPDQPAGRGQQVQSPPVKIYAKAHGIPVLQPERLKDPGFVDLLRSFDAELFIVVAFRMMPEVVWGMPPSGTFNLHASLLPNYRGAAPINHAIMNGETETGLTTFFLRHEIDTGAILLQEKLSIGPEETAGELHDRMKSAGAALVLKTVRAIESGSYKTFEQDILSGTSAPLKPAPKLFRADCRIDWLAGLDRVYNKIRGLSPYPAAFTIFRSPAGEELTLKIYRGRKSPDYCWLPPGGVITDQKHLLGVTSPGGTLYFEEVQQAGKRVMKVTEFLNGFKVESDWQVGL